MPATQAPPNRRLTAILAADIAGFSALMSADEEQTVRHLKQMQQTVFPLIATWQGRVIDTAGDGILAEFPSITSAIHCAVAMQNAMLRRNLAMDPQQRMLLRIGVNQGDVIYDDIKIYGDGVNIAARLEAICEPGGVCISEKVYDEIRNKIALPWEHGGEHRLKNIPEPIGVYLLTADRLSMPTPHAPAPPVHSHHRQWPRRRLAWLTSRPVSSSSIRIALLIGFALVTALLIGFGLSPRHQQTPDRPAIAVLPFKNLSGDPEQTYFSNGITEDISTALSRFRTLTVISYKASLQVTGEDLPIADVGRRLKARYLVDGSVRRNAQRIRVLARVTDVASAKEIWSYQYDDRVADVFVLQERVAREVGGALAANLERIVLRHSTAQPASRVDAYDMVLRGRAAARRHTRAGNREARRQFKLAIATDSTYADAYAQLASAYLDRALFGWSPFSSEEVGSAIELSNKAVSLDPSNAMAHGILARCYAIRTQYDLALAASDRSLRFNPNDAEVHAVRAEILLWRGQLAKSLEASEIVARLNPLLDPNQYFNFGLAYFLSRQYDKAIQVLEEASTRHPDFSPVKALLAASYAETGFDRNAQEAAAATIRLNPFFRSSNFGSRLQSAQMRRQLQQSLKKVGLI